MEEGKIDGYCCSIESSGYVQESIEKLVSLVKGFDEGHKRSVHWSSRVITGFRPKNEDTMSMYIAKGTLYGFKEGFDIVLKASHEILPSFSSKNPNFMGAYYDLVNRIKYDLNEETLAYHTNDFFKRMVDSGKEIPKNPILFR